MQPDTPSFQAWQRAEQRAASAERRLFAKVLVRDHTALPTREEVEEVRVLRTEATTQMQQMLEDMRVRCAANRRGVVQSTTSAPLGGRDGTTAPDAASANSE